MGDGWSPDLIAPYLGLLLATILMAGGISDTLFCFAMLAMELTLSDAYESDDEIESLKKVLGEGTTINVRERCSYINSAYLLPQIIEEVTERSPQVGLMQANPGWPHSKGDDGGVTGLKLHTTVSPQSRIHLSATCTCTYVRVCMYVYVCMHVCTCMYACMYVYV